MIIQQHGAGLRRELPALQPAFAVFQHHSQYRPVWIPVKDSLLFYSVIAAFTRTG
ncbi:hypothetical protein [Pseudobacillus badius]|uniref:hypothetical protein n=1 Tax=Bacillus badius TaxID=1455 RepID=UPI000A6060FA|nr:hypothetical protein [Bacillus badius]